MGSYTTSTMCVKCILMCSVILHISIQGPTLIPRTDIVGGQVVEPHSIPYQVSLQLTEWGDWHFCGGSILSENIVVTTGHCCYELDLKGVKVVAGAHDLYAEEDTQQVAGVSSATIHPGYDPWTVENDICLLQLDNRLEIKYGVDRIKPAVTGEIFTGVGRVSGWGTLSEGGVAPDMLMSVEVTLHDDAECCNSYGDEAVKDSMLCAGDTGKDACEGDSGGPLVCKSQFSSSYDKLCGIVSWGLGCGKEGYPGVYTEVAFFKQWIDSVMYKE